MAIENNGEIVAQAICDYERSIAKIILLCVDDFNLGFGAGKLVQLLKGNQTAFITDFSLQNNISFSLLKQFSKHDLEYIIKILAQTGYLNTKAYKGNLGEVYNVSQKGYEFLEKDLPLEISFIDTITESDFIDLDNGELKLYKRLRRIRYRIASREELPAYSICNDLPLRKMARNLPTTYDEMLEIKGIGHNFIEKYADRFIEEIKDSKDDNE